MPHADSSRDSIGPPRDAAPVSDTQVYTACADAYPQSRGRLVYVVTEDWYFCSHRLQLAIKAKAAGFDVWVLTRVQQHGDVIRAAGLHLIPIRMVRRKTSISGEVRSILELSRLFRQVRPNIIHNVALKPVVYGTVAAWMARAGVVVNAIAGLGWVFVSRSLKARVLRVVAPSVLRRILGAGWVIVQNPDDLSFLRKLGVKPRGVHVVKGAGVDLSIFSSTEELRTEMPVVMLLGRMLWDKGVGEFVEAARTLSSRGIRARFVLVGGKDSSNPAGIPGHVLGQWVQEGVIEWWGHRDDVPSTYAQANLVCLPSYREGLPKSLVEAAACGRAIVATDVPGCKEVVRHGFNGLLVPARNASALSDAIERLLDDENLRRQMALNGRRLAEEEFSLAYVVRETLAVYEECRRHDGASNRS